MSLIKTKYKRRVFQSKKVADELLKGGPINVSERYGFRKD